MVMIPPKLYDYEPESRFTKPTPLCPHPERWMSSDDDSTEREVSSLVAGFVTALQPDLVVETGTAFGQTAMFIGNALMANGQGQLVTYEPNSDRVQIARDRCEGLPVTVVEAESTDPTCGISAIDEDVQFAWLDSLLPLRIHELDVIYLKLSKGAIVGVHDCGDKFPSFHERMLAAARNAGMNHITLPTPRGVTFLEKK